MNLSRVVPRAQALRRALHERYRATGADLPFGDPLLAHGVDMEGYFWRFTDAEAGRAVIALIGVNRGPGRRWSQPSWATVALASIGPDGQSFLREAELPGAWARQDRVGASSGEAFFGDDGRVKVDLGPDARLDLRLSELVGWPRAAWGGSSVFHSVPGLNQYWHPWLLGGRAVGTATLGDQEWSLDGAQVYAEKNWGKEGFPDSWWWGQAQGFAESGACVAFAGGEVYVGGPSHLGPRHWRGLQAEVTALVVRLPDGRLIRLGDPVVSPVQAQVTDETWRLRGRGFGWGIEVDATAPLSQAHVLPVPLPSAERNTPGAIEHLGGRLEVSVTWRGRPVWSGVSQLAGLEHGGLDRAAAELRRRGGRPAGQGGSDAG